MEAGVHLPQLAFSEPASKAGTESVVDAARDLGFVALSANDHLTFSRPWTDGLVLLATAAARSGSLELATTVALPTVRGPHQYAATMLALDRMSEGRVVAGVGAGSSRADHDLVGVPWSERWERFDASLDVLRAQFASSADRPAIPLWVASWGSAAGIARVAEHGDGWVASAFHADPEEFGRARTRLARECARRGRPEPPHALVTMWTWVTQSPRDAERVLTEVLAPALDREPDSLRGRVCVGSAESCAELLSAYAARGCRRVHFWPVADEADQLLRLVRDVLPAVTDSP